MNTGYLPDPVHGKTRYWIEYTYGKPLPIVLREQYAHSPTAKGLAVRLGVSLSTMKLWLKTYKIGPYKD